MNSTGRMHSNSGKIDLDRDLHRFLLGSLPALDPHLRCLGSQHVGDRDPVGVGLDHGTGESPQVVDIGPARQAFVGLASRAAHLDVLQRSDQLFGQRAVAVAAGLGHGRLETEAGLDGDGHLVEGVGQLERDRLAALLAAAVQQELRHEEGDDRHGGGEDACARSAGRDGVEHAQDGRTEPQHDLGGDQPFQRPSRRAAGACREPVEPTEHPGRDEAPRQRPAHCAALVRSSCVVRAVGSLHAPAQVGHGLQTRRGGAAEHGPGQQWQRDGEQPDGEPDVCRHGNGLPLRMWLVRT